AAAGGMTDMHSILQVEMCGKCGKVVSIVIHVVTVARLRGPAVAAAVMGYDAIAVTQEEQHLCVPVICGQRPPMAEHDGLTLAPVLVEDLNAVFGRDGRHSTVSLLELIGLLCGAYDQTVRRYLPDRAELLAPIGHEGLPDFDRLSHDPPSLHKSPSLIGA